MDFTEECDFLGRKCLQHLWRTNLTKTLAAEFLLSCDLSRYQNEIRNCVDDVANARERLVLANLKAT